MSNATRAVIAAMLVVISRCAQGEPVETVKPVSFADVKVDKGFWSDRLEASRTVTIPHCLKKCEETKRIENFAVAAGLKKGVHVGAQYNDSDLYKILQGAIYSLKTHRDPKLEKQIDDIIATIAAAQQPDGYLYTLFSIGKPEERFKHISPGPKHELYCMGHFIEAAVEHHRMTGKRTMLNVAIKLADHIDSVFGPGRQNSVPHHQQVESALIELYCVTKEKRYLKLASFFIDHRGDTAHRPSVTFYGQDHLPVRKQSEIVGHAVRGMYNCVNMASLYAETGDAELLAATRRLWSSATGRKMYVTGAVGSIGRGESYGNDYQLPNGTAYAETCAGIGLIYFAHRMWRIDPDAEYIDVLERALYNEVIGGVAIKGDAFFYPNKLLSTGQGWGSMRQNWFRCACCPSNICRFIPVVPGYMYGHLGRELYVNSFLPGRAAVKTAFQTVTLRQETNYPWSGAVKIIVNPAKTAEFTINVRIPGWARNQPSPGDLYRHADQTIKPPIGLKVNGKAAAVELKRGYAQLKRTWSAGDTIALDLPMPVRRILAHDKVVNNAGRVALQRGPIVYCAEWPDNEGKVFGIVLDDDVALKSEHRKDILGGVTVLTATLKNGKKFTAIPFYARLNRGKGEINVWIARTAAAAKRISTGPLPHDWESLGPIKASHVFPPRRLAALTDNKLPKSSRDPGVPHFSWEYHTGSVEWVQKTYPKPTRLSSVEVYWFDQSPEGPCRLPRSWRVIYRAENKWKTIEPTGDYGLELDRFNKVTFKEITTSIIRIEATLQQGFSGGIMEMRIK